MAHEITTYTSYLVRMWQEGRPDQPDAAVWHSEAEHIQTGQRRRFDDPADLWAFLNRPGAQNDPATNDA